MRMSIPGTAPTGRLGGAALAGLVNAGLLAMLLFGLGAPVRQAIERPVEVFDIAPPAPRERERPQPPPPRRSNTPAERRAAPGRESAGAPPNLVSRASEVVAPVPILRLPALPPIIAAPRPADGARTSGAASVRGPGSGAGGEGDGFGAGRGGGGNGGGGGDGSANTPPRLLRELRRSDYPKAAAEAGMGGIVGVLYTIDLRGRAIDCEVTRSSGDRPLDRDTCALIEKRYRYEPSRDPAGRPVYSRIEHDMIWHLEQLPQDPPQPTRR